MATSTMNPAMADKGLTAGATDHVPLRTWICVMGDELFPARHCRNAGSQLG
jgi:hypothetical protein